MAQDAPDATMAARRAQLRHVSRSPIRVAVLPLGATEPHNLHLPYGTDTFQVETVAEAGVQLGVQSRGAGRAAPDPALRDRDQSDEVPAGNELEPERPWRG